MGQYLSTGGSKVNEGAFFGNPTENRELVETRFSETLEKADEVYGLLMGDEGFLAALKNAVSAYPTISIQGTSVITDIEIDKSGGVSPQFDSNSLISYPDTLVSPPDDFTLDDIFTDDLLADLPGEQEDISVTWSESDLPSELYDAVLSRMQEDLANGSTGLSEDVETAIYQRARYRQQQTNQNEYDRINNSVLEMQFSMPSGVLAAALTDFSIGAARADADIENQIIVNQGELAQKNSQFIIQQSVVLEQLIRNTREGESNRNLDSAKHVATLISEKYRTAIQRFSARIQNLQIIASARADNIKNAVERYRALVSRYATDAEVLKIESESVTAHNRGLVDVFSSEIQGFAETEKAISSRNASTVALLDAQIKNAELDVRAAIATAEETMKGYTTESSLAERVAEAVANLAAQVVASMMSAVHAGATLSYNGSESTSLHGQISVSNSEQHSYEEQSD